jgi:glycosyltransferase involved in cell wall biosynthesis
MPELKVAHVTTVPVSLEILLLDQLLYLKAAGLDLVGISSDGPQSSALTKRGIRHIAIPMTREIAPLRDLVSIWRLFWLFRRERFDLVHTHNPKPALVARIAARLAGVPVVIHTIHGLHFHENTPPLLKFILKSVEKFGGLFGDLVFSQNREDMELSVKEGIYPSRKLRFLGNGIDLQRFNPEVDHSADVAKLRRSLGIMEGAAVVGFVGRLARGRKGVEDLLRAMTLLISDIPNLQLLLVGAPDEGKSDSISPAEIQELAGGVKCIFAGWRSQDEMPVIYKLMNVLVLPSSFEGLPRAIMEASAMGIPVVATDVKGNREAVKNRVTGVLAPFGDLPALAAGIKEVVTNSVLATTLGANGRINALESFDQEKVFSTTLATYRELIEAKR